MPTDPASRSRRDKENSAIDTGADTEPQPEPEHGAEHSQLPANGQGGERTTAGLEVTAASARAHTPDIGPVGEGEGTETAPAPAPDSAGSGKSGPSTVPLFEAEAPPLPVLAAGMMVGERYEIASLITSTANSNIYEVVDQQGYRRCWACGAESSEQGDIYCVECGAQLSGKRYRLQQLRMPSAHQSEVETDESQSQSRNRGLQAGPDHITPVHPAILHNEVPGVARVFDVVWAPDAEQVYVVWEQPEGRSLASWLHTGKTTGLLDQDRPPHPDEDLPEEQLVALIEQAAELLARLHSHGIVGCTITSEDLIVQGNDRLLLANPSGCRPAEGMPEQQLASVQASEVRNLATELERWYLAVREQPASPPQTEEGASAGMQVRAGPEAGAGAGTPPSTAPVPSAGDGTESAGIAGVVVAAEDATGPLTAPNLSTLLARAREGAYPTAQAFAEALRDLHHALRPPRNLQLVSGRASDLGRVRQVNEDTVLALEVTVLEEEGNLAAGLYVVADGMGGHQSGEVASSIAARTVGSMVNSALLGPLASGDPVAADPRTCSGLLRQAVLEANRRISDLAQERHSDLGTTLVAALITGNLLTIANVGDSRAYLWRNRQLRVITRDHSLVAQLVATGQLAPEEIYTHPRRNEIYRALGDPRLTAEEIDLFTDRLQPGDGLLLCSDGLWDFVRDPLIAQLLSKCEDEDPQTICEALVAEANEHGGEDNISVIFVRLTAGGRSDEARSNASWHIMS